MDLAHVVAGLAEGNRQIHDLAAQLAVGCFGLTNGLGGLSDLGTQILVALLEGPDQFAESTVLGPQGLDLGGHGIEIVGQRLGHARGVYRRLPRALDSVAVRMSLRTAVAHRNLLYLLSLKELRTRYRKSVLGWAWTLLNPLSQMVIFTFVFSVAFNQEAPVGNPSGLQIFPIYLLCGLLPFQFFSISVTTAIANMSSNSSLITKVSFPHEHLVLSIVIAQLVTFLIEIAVLSVAILIAGQMVIPWLFPYVFLVMLLSLFTTGVALALSAANVFFHDVNYLWSIVAQVLFYLTPIIWVPANIDNDLLDTISNWHPTGSFIRASQQLLYGGYMPSIWRWLHLSVVATVTFLIGAWIFSRLSPRFAEEL